MSLLLYPMQLKKPISIFCALLGISLATCTYSLVHFLWSTVMQAMEVPNLPLLPNTGHPFSSLSQEAHRSSVSTNSLPTTLSNGHLLRFPEVNAMSFKLCYGINSTSRYQFLYQLLWLKTDHPKIQWLKAIITYFLRILRASWAPLHSCSTPCTAHQNLPFLTALQSPLCRKSTVHTYVSVSGLN